MNLNLIPGAVYNLPITSEALSTVLNALAGRPYAEVAPLMTAIASEVGRQNQELAKPCAIPTPPVNMGDNERAPDAPETGTVQ